MQNYEKIKAITQPDVIQIINDWYANLGSKKLSENTLEAYLSDIYFFLNFLFEEKKSLIDINYLESFSIAVFRKFLSEISDKRIASSRARTISSIKNFYRFCEKRNLLKNEVIFQIKLPKIPKNLPRAIEVDKTLEVIKNISDIENFKENSLDWVAQRDKALLTIIYSCGLRISEAINLKIGDFFGNNNFIRIKGKGGKERDIPVISEAVKEIEKLKISCPYIDIDNSESYLFFGKSGKNLNPTVFQKIVREAKKLYNLPEGSTPHAFRHSFATHLLSQSADLVTVQELLGHSSLSSTQIYTKVSPARIFEELERIG